MGYQEQNQELKIGYPEQNQELKIGYPVQYSKLKTGYPKLGTQFCKKLSFMESLKHFTICKISQTLY